MTAADWTKLFAPRAAGMTASEIRELLKLLDRPDIVSFAGGIPDPDLFPAEAVAGAYQRTLSSNSLRTVALQYAVSEGYAPLREWIAARMTAEGGRGRADEILITNGSQQGLDFVGKLFVGPGEPVLVTAPTYLGALQAFAPYEPRYLSVPMDEEGPDMEALEAALAQRPKLFYLVPDFQNPSGQTVSLARRRAIVEMCARAGVPIVEDAAYVRLRYEGEDLPSLHAIDAERAAAEGDEGNVIHLGTFSKVLVPALRIGWAAGPKPVIQRMVLIKQASDLHCSTVNQIVALDVADAVHDAQLPRLRAAYRARRDAMLAAVEAHMSGLARWTRPQGGMFVWLELPEGVDGGELLKRSVEEAKVAFVPGAAFFPDRGRRNTARLSFSLARPDVIAAAIPRFAAAVAAQAESPRAAAE